MNKRLKVVYVTISLVLAISIVFLASIIISRNINYSRVGLDEVLKYNLTNDIDYKVNVSDNEYYNNNTNNENIISSIIKDIDLTFNYNINLEDEVNTRIKYVISSKLVVNQLKDISVIPLLEEEKVILENDIINKGVIDIKESITNDYKYYYDYVEKYQSMYPIAGLDAKIIYSFKVDTTGIYNKEYLEDSSKSIITISLLNPITNISKIEYNNTPRVLVVERELPFIKNPVTLVLGIIVLLIGIFLLIPLFMAIRLVNKQNEFRRTINHYLKVYDDAIVESNSKVKINKKQIIEVTTFYELLDAYQELHIPIVFNEVEEGKEAWFTISNNKKIWRFILKNKNIS